MRSVVRSFCRHTRCICRPRTCAACSFFFAILSFISFSASAQTVGAAKPAEAREAHSSAVDSSTDTGKEKEGQNSSYRPITGKQRLQWFAVETVRPQSLTAGLITAAYGTGIDKPKEYGSHWGGFADRYGMRFTGTSTGNAMEAALSALWGEDPRYFRSRGESFGPRVKKVIRMTFVAYRRDGHLVPAYARCLAIPGSNFLSNTWRADSEANSGNAVIRTLLGFAGRMGSNAFKEFWPDASQHIFPRKPLSRR